MDSTSKNRYQIFADQLREHCRRCRSNNADKCSETNYVCDEFEAKANQLRYDLLHPHNPCGRCIVRPTCSWEKQCDDRPTQERIIWQEALILFCLVITNYLCVFVDSSDSLVPEIIVIMQQISLDIFFQFVSVVPQCEL